MRLVLAALALGASLGSAGATELTEDNWAEKTAGKTLFIEFHAPWCKFCIKLKPTWKKLTTHYEKSETLLLGHVDCTGEGKSLCRQFNVKSYPSIQYGNAAHLDKYSGRRKYDELKAFAAALKPLCSPESKQNCNAADAKLVEKFEKMSATELDTLAETLEEELQEVQNEFEATVEELEARVEIVKKKLHRDKQAKKHARKEKRRKARKQYEAHLKKIENNRARHVSNINNRGYELVQAVLQHRKNEL